MKILFTGGGTGGHFYPIIAVAEEINRITKEEKLIQPELFYMAPSPYDERALFENNIAYRYASAGKIRRYFSILNFFDFFKTGFGVLKALISVFAIFPDVVFAKGGYASFPALFAAKILRIPVVIHESDTSPGKVSAWAGKFAERIAVSYKEAGKFFPEEKVAWTGNPIRTDLIEVVAEGARDFLKLEEGASMILILGGSQGAQNINDAILDSLSKLVEKYQIVHQTGEKHYKLMADTSKVVLRGNARIDRYHPYAYLNTLTLRMAAGVADLIITRAGSTLFEVAIWKVPAIVIPIPKPTSHDQTGNAFAYARAGAGIVMEEKNVTPSLLLFEIDKIMGDKKLQMSMREAASKLAKPDAAEKIARVIIEIALSHETA
jgi:UDP-N-acetylglucosamine--N-acetylmuramyl-(pentapeptide) pyrophosphoryl-undecaprenol N-acetylglucosamine transferase